MRIINFRKRNQGQGMSEYIIIIALIAITSIAAVKVLGNSVKYQMAKTVQKFLGKSGTGGISKPSVTKGAFKARDLSDFDEAND